MALIALSGVVADEAIHGTMKCVLYAAHTTSSLFAPSVIHTVIQFSLGDQM